MSPYYLSKAYITNSVQPVNDFHHLHIEQKRDFYNVQRDFQFSCCQFIKKQLP